MPDPTPEPEPPTEEDLVWLENNWNISEPMFRQWLAGSDRAHALVLCVIAEVRRLGAMLQDAERVDRDRMMENTRLRVALKPFADYAIVEDLSSGHNAPDEGVFAETTSPTLTKTLIIGDFRRARAALESRSDGA
jgi:hypothetical protein